MSRLKDKEGKESAFIEEYLDRLEKAESAGNPKARNPMPGQTASGLHQFTEGTWKDVVKRHKLNYSLDDRFDPEKSRQVATLHTLDNKRYLEKHLNRKVNMVDLYTIHFLGIGRGKEFLQALEKDPYMSVGTLLNDAEIRNNPSYVRQKEDSSRKHTGRLNVLAETYNKLSQVLGQEPRDFFNEIVEKDTNIYAIDSNGNYVTLNPNFATEQDIQNSGVIKKQFYNEYLTNLQGLEENPNFEEVINPDVFIGTEEQTPIQNIINNHYYNSEDTKEDKKVSTEVEEAKNILDERQFLVGLIQAGAFDLQNPEYERVPQMHTGGKIPKMQLGGEKEYVNFGTPEYEKAYNEGTLLHNRLDDVVLPPVTSIETQQILKTYPYYLQLSEEEKKYINDNSPIGRNIRMKAMGDKMSDVNEYWINEVAAERKATRERSDANVLNQWSSEALNPKNWTRQNFYEMAEGLESKMRVSDKPNFFDDVINPAAWIGSMASSLGKAPLEAEQSDSVMPYVTSIGVPLATGAMSTAFGSISNAKFAENMINPLPTDLRLAERISNVGKNVKNATIETINKQRDKMPKVIREANEISDLDKEYRIPLFSKKAKNSLNKYVDNLVETRGKKSEIISRVELDYKDFLERYTKLRELSGYTEMQNELGKLHKILQERRVLAENIENLYLEYPQFMSFLSKKGLINKNTKNIDKFMTKGFIEEFEKSYFRGARSLNDIPDGLDYREPLLNPTGAGGERLGPGRYESNSHIIADRFSRSDEGKGYKTIIETIPDIDRSDPKNILKWIKENVRNTEFKRRVENPKITEGVYISPRTAAGEAGFERVVHDKTIPTRIRSVEEVTDKFEGVNRGRFARDAADGDLIDNTFYLETRNQVLDKYGRKLDSDEIFKINRDRIRLEDKANKIENAIHKLQDKVEKEFKNVRSSQIEKMTEDIKILEEAREKIYEILRKNRKAEDFVKIAAVTGTVAGGMGTVLIRNMKNPRGMSGKRNKNKEEKTLYQQGGQIPTSSQGLYEYPNQTVRVPTEDGRITMKGIPYPVVGISAETGEQILMYPNQEYQFKNTKNVIEIPLSQYGTK